MGYCLIFENMLPSVIDIRKRYLSDNGMIIPRKAELFLAGFCRMQDDYLICLSADDKKVPSKARIETIEGARVVTTH
jgi:hypothetical protein